jgi:hypothetical protein
MVRWTSIANARSRNSYPVREAHAAESAFTHISFLSPNLSEASSSSAIRTLRGSAARAHICTRAEPASGAC